MKRKTKGKIERLVFLIISVICAINIQDGWIVLVFFILFFLSKYYMVRKNKRDINKNKEDENKRLEKIKNMTKKEKLKYNSETNHFFG